MSPTIEIGDHFGTFEIKDNNINRIKRFDIVVYKLQPNNAKVEMDIKTKLVHRVVGMPNEKIEIKKGLVYINDRLLDESSFEKTVGGIDFPSTTIPENEYFLLGDNRPKSLDSRYWIKPTITREDIYGKVGSIIRKEDYAKGKRW